MNSGIPRAGHNVSLVEHLNSLPGVSYIRLLATVKRLKVSERSD